MDRKILQCHPFCEYPIYPVELIEGFSMYDGNLGDKVGDPHKGIDFVRRGDICTKRYMLIYQRCLIFLNILGNTKEVSGQGLGGRITILFEVKWFLRVNH